MGRAPREGKLPKRKKGVQVKWSPRGRNIGYDFGQQVFRKHGGDYRKFYEKALRDYKNKHPELRIGYLNTLAMNKTIKLFLSHFWQIARLLDGKPITAPYSEVHLGHVGILEPFHMSEPLKKLWDERNKEKQAA